ncbi:MAG: DNA-processing protein DprA [Pseudomonadota bacterium]
MPGQDLSRWLSLAMLPQFGPARLKALHQILGTPENIMSGGEASLVKAGFSKIFIDDLQPFLTAKLPDTIKRQQEECLAWVNQQDRCILTFDSAEYPPLLYETADPPPLLFVWGDPQTLSLPQIAIVGSRNPTPDGRKNARRFAGELAIMGYEITSGLALGIDAESHQGALDKQSTTVAVLGTGLDRIYPRQNNKLAIAITSAGALVSEFLPQTGPDSWNFPRRNRIISGLAHGVLVVEAAQQSGSLITARTATEQGREVFVLPGSIHNPMAKGCHQLIRQGAKLVDCVDDILEEFPALVAWEKNRLAKSADCESVTSEAAKNSSLSRAAKKLLPFIAYDPVSVDGLMLRSGQELAAIHAALVELELHKQITVNRGGYVLSR